MSYFIAWKEIKITKKKIQEGIKMIPGRGMGQGFSRQGLGGFNYCRCPICGYAISHRKNIPCNQLKCPECGNYMIGD